MRIIVMILFGVALYSGSGFAQTGSPRNASVSRRLFSEGVEAARERKWEEALEKFQRSYEIAPRTMTLINLAGAQVNTGRLVAASESYRRFLRETTDSTQAKLRTAAAKMLQSLEERIAYAQIRVSGLAPMDKLKLDSDEFSRASLGEAVPMDPGPHMLTVERNGRNVAQRRFTIAEGQTQEINFAAPSATVTPEENLSSATPTDRAARSRSSGSSIWKSPILWTAVGVVVVGGAAAAYFLTRGDPDPHQSTLGSAVITVR
jgi:hypothetical protein